MRSTTKTFVASVGMGICAISYAVGSNSAAGTTFSLGALNNTAATNSTDGTSGANNSASAAPSTSSSAANSGSTNGSIKTSAAAKKKSKKKASTGSSDSSTPAPSSSSSSSATPTPKPSASTPAPKPSTSTPPPTSNKVTKTGATIQGNDPFGDYAQVQVTKTNGKVTAVQVVSSYSNGGREQVFPYLAQEAVASNGGAVSNYSGATYTTNVFNKALASAMSKF